MSILKVFISYSHDTIEHKNWVLELGTRLRKNGIDAILDQWELTPGDDLPHFMETNLASADYIILICTERYVLKSNQGEGGVGYEKMIITSNLMKNINESKIIPIVKQNGTFNVPTFLKTKLFIDFSKNDGYEFNFDELIRKLHNSPIFLKPEIGENPFNVQNSTQNKKQFEIIPQIQHKDQPLVELMKKIVSDYENGANWTSKEAMKEYLNLSRILFDLTLAEALAKKFIKIDSDGDLILIDGGKMYAIQNNLID